MYDVSSNFKNSIKEPIKEIDAYLLLEDLTIITPADDLVSLKIESENGVGKLVMKKIEIKLLGYHSVLLSEKINAYVGVKTETGYEYINYGQFLITEVEDSKDTGMSILKGYDSMIYTNVAYSSVDVQYPCTVYQYALAVCQKCGLTLASESWPSSDIDIESDRYIGIDGMQYRDVLNDIAAASGTIAILSNDKLYFKSITNTEETLTYDDLKTLKLQPKYGPINGVVIARTPQEDNVAVQDEESVQENGLTEYRIENNQLIDDKREDYLQNLANQMFGLEYYPFEAKTIGLAYFEIGDMLTIQAEDGDYSVYISSISLNVDGSINETIKSSSVEKTNTNYSRAGGLTKRINRTEIIVDKQAGEIESAVEATVQLYGELQGVQADLQFQITNQATLIQQNSQEIILRALQETVDREFGSTNDRVDMLETHLIVSADGVRVVGNDASSYTYYKDKEIGMVVDGQTQFTQTQYGTNTHAINIDGWVGEVVNSGNTYIKHKKGS